MNMRINYLAQMLKECLISWSLGFKYPLILSSIEMKLTIIMFTQLLF